MPVLSWSYKMNEIIRATWANNHGELLATHPSMSEVSTIELRKSVSFDVPARFVRFALCESVVLCVCARIRG